MVLVMLINDNDESNSCGGWNLLKTFIRTFQVIMQLEPGGFADCKHQQFPCVFLVQMETLHVNLTVY